MEDPRPTLIVTVYPWRGGAAALPLPTEIDEHRRLGSVRRVGEGPEAHEPIVRGCAVAHGLRRRGVGSWMPVADVLERRPGSWCGLISRDSP